MRASQLRSCLAACAGFSVLVGCTESGGLFDSVDSLVLGTSASADDSAAAAASPDAADGGGASTPAGDSTPRLDSLVAEGEVGSGDYRLFELGAGDAGEAWTISPIGSQPAFFIVVLFDENQNLLSRDYVGTGYGFEHVLRSNTSRLTLGIMPSGGSSGGNFRMRATRASGAVPTPQPQVVWLNFAGGQNISVHGARGVSFDAFDAGTIADLYAGASAEMKRAIVDVIVADYAGYNVTLLTSDDGPAPEDATIVHFGGYDSGLLGLADSVDGYNRELRQSAIVYLESFAAYRTMRLSVDEMGEMIGNVASHELGHLLGLYHTRDPNDVMDTTGTAWQLAASQTFSRASLESSVFAIGWEDSPTMLAHSVGIRADAAKSIQSARQRRPLREWLSRFTAEETRHSCGTCIHLDGHLPSE